jgi:hypothetical protein
MLKKLPLILTAHAKNRIDEHDLRRAKVLQLFQNAVRVDLTKSSRLKRYKYGWKQKNVEYYRAGKLLFIVVRRKKNYLCLTIVPEGKT